MNNASAKKLFSILFLTIFFCKVVISIAPVIAAHFDCKSSDAALMQLEIEDDAKPADIKEMSVKEYLTVTNYHFDLVTPVVIIEPITGNDDHAKHIQPFYPAVPTPPPNV